MQEKTKRFQIFITTYYYSIGIYKNSKYHALVVQERKFKKEKENMVLTEFRSEFLKN